jgi:signal transduction histidine kinase
VTSRGMDVAGLRVQVASASDDALATFRTRRGHMLLLCALVSLGLFAVYRLLARMHAESLERARALSRARGELQALNARLDSQVQERTAQLEQAYRDLETFSYAVAHDVRAPLASIAGFAEALEPAITASRDDKALHYLKRIRANALQMDELTRQLLELGRLTRAPLATTRVDLSALAHEVLAGLRDADPQRQVGVTVQPELWARGDRTLLRQVLENLLGNAWKFTSRRDAARISVARGPAAAEGELVVVVADDGEGFDSERATDLFQPFRRMHSREEFPGTGVGLAAVRRIIALHGGRVWAESRRGSGARFFFSLPA